MHSLGIPVMQLTLLSKHRLRCSLPPTVDWYTLMRRLQSPAGKGGDMIFWTRIMSRNSPKLFTRHVNLPLRRAWSAQG